MKNVTRRTLLQVAGAALAAPALAAPAISRPSRAGTLRFVPGSNLSTLDPIWTPATPTTGHAYHVFDTLFAVNRALEPKPQMIEAFAAENDGRLWTLRLREGLLFHDNSPVLARDAVASIRRWSRRDAFGALLATFTDVMEVIDDRSFRIRCSRPFRHLPDALGHPVALGCFIMPERLALTDPFKQVTEMVGSGPYRFLANEFVPGSSAAYARFEGYRPRDEPADYASGGKRATFDRVEWHILPDVATAAAALQTGEVDWWQTVPSDLVATLRNNRAVRVEDADPSFSAMHFNCVQPPFNNARLRHAVLTAVDQNDYMQSISSSDEHAWRTCFAMMGCGLAHVRELGAGLMAPPRDLAASRALVAQAGYNGEKIVILSPTDQPSAGPHGTITADTLRRLGMNVDLQEMDFGTIGQRRTSREPVSRGGWSIYHNNTLALALANPALDFFIRGQGNAGYFGWFDSPEMEAIAAEWLGSSNDAEDDRLFDAAQRLAFELAPMVPLGMFSERTATRADVIGIAPGSVLTPWSARRV